MNKRENSSAVIDGILRLIVGGGAIATIVIAPNMAKVIDKPVYDYFKKLNKRQREREFKRLLYYVKQRGLVESTSEDYAHGLVITDKGRKRLNRREFETLNIAQPKKWDNRWRLVFFDIPEEHKIGRRQLITKLKLLGFVQLQRSVWVYPFPCRQEVELVTSKYEVQKYVSYVEAVGIDAEDLLKKRFKHVL
jgi:DNA-binding transcriptional regulator PaaX